MKKKLTEKQKKKLRTLAHKLKPIVIIGDSGLSENVLREIDLSLEHHELLKIRINAADRQERTKLIKKIEAETYSEVIVSIGHIAVIYRTSEQKKIQF